MTGFYSGTYMLLSKYSQRCYFSDVLQNKTHFSLYYNDNVPKVTKIRRMLEKILIYSMKSSRRHCIYKLQIVPPPSFES